MGLIKEIPSFIAGVRCNADENSGQVVKSLDGQITIPSAVTSASQLREALRFAVKSQEKLYRSTLEERIEVVKLVLKGSIQYREQIVWGLAQFRGLVAQDGHWMCDLLNKWSEQVEELAALIWGGDSKGPQLVRTPDGHKVQMGFRSRGEAALITSSTMDGPPGIAAICHAILSGTHVIVRPSWKDVATHFMFEVLHEHKLDHYAQLVRWPSTDPSTMALNQQLIGNVQQAIVFASDKTFDELIQGLGDDKPLFARKIVKYGTGLPLVIVTGESDLDDAAKKIFLGARRGNGKFCLSHSPVLVQKNYYKSLLAKLVDLSKGLKAGDTLNREVERGRMEPEDLQGLGRLAASFGGRTVHGKIGTEDMDVVILEDVSPNSPCLYQEFPGTLLALIPYSTQEEAVAIAQKNLKANNREAWTAVNFFGSEKEYREFSNLVDSYHFLRGGVTSEPKFILPHQGRYFALDLTRRLTTED